MKLVRLTALLDVVQITKLILLEKVRLLFLQRGQEKRNAASATGHIGPWRAVGQGDTSDIYPWHFSLLHGWPYKQYHEDHQKRIPHSFTQTFWFSATLFLALLCKLFASPAAVELSSLLPLPLFHLCHSEWLLWGREQAVGPGYLPVLICHRCDLRARSSGTEAKNPEGFQIPITHILWDLLQVIFCLVPNFLTPHAFWSSLIPWDFTCSTTGHSLRYYLKCHMKIPSSITWVHTCIPADSAQAEFGQHLLSYVLKGKVKDLIPRLYQLIQNRQGIIRKTELRGHRESLVK